MPKTVSFFPDSKKIEIGKFEKNKIRKKLGQISGRGGFRVTREISKSPLRQLPPTFLVFSPKVEAASFQQEGLPIGRPTAGWGPDSVDDKTSSRSAYLMDSQIAWS